MTASEIIQKYISFFEKRGHKRIPNSSLVPENDPTTLFTSSGMQPLVPYLLGEPHPSGKKLVNVQNSLRAVDIDEVGDNRHTTFFRMLGNWSLGNYFKKEEITWLWEFLTSDEGLKLDKSKLYVTIFSGDNNSIILNGGKSEILTADDESKSVWNTIFKKYNLNSDERIISYGVENNWWSRAGTPEKMPIGEIGGPDTEVFYEFTDVKHNLKYGEKCHPNCACGRFLEIGNSVFMQYKKVGEKTLKPLLNKNVDFGGGVERILAATENKSDIFQTSIFAPTIKIIEKETGKTYKENSVNMQIVTDHLGASVFILNANIKPSNKEQGYILRRLLRRAFDNFYALDGKDVSPIIHKIIETYRETDPYLETNFEQIKSTILTEEQNYRNTLQRAKTYIQKKYPEKEGIKWLKKISAEDAFILYSTHGLSPSQIKSLGYSFDEQTFAQKMEEHQILSRKGFEKKFAGGLADHSEKTIMGHTATHLLHKALRELFGEKIHQSGSNITPQRIRFDFNFDRRLTDEEIKNIENIINQKIKENLAVHYEIMSLTKAKEIKAIGLFNEKYQDKVKVYFIGNYSKEICGGPHVNFTSELKRFKIIKQENIGKGYRRIYAMVG